MGRSMVNGDARVVPVAARSGFLAFYLVRFPGTVPMKLPDPTSAIELLSRTIGVGALAPARGILKDVWVAILLFFYCVTDTA